MYFPSGGAETPLKGENVTLVTFVAFEELVTPFSLQPSFISRVYVGSASGSCRETLKFLLNDL